MGSIVHDAGRDYATTMPSVPLPPPVVLNGITIGGKPVYEAAAGQSSNIFETHTGASRYGRGRFLMVRSDYDALISGLASGSQTVSLVMSSGPAPTGQNK